MRKWVKKHKKRIFAFILSLVLGVGSAFALSCPAFADSNVQPDSINVTYVFDSYSTLVSGYYTTETTQSTPLGQTGTEYTFGIDYKGYRDVTVSVDEHWYFDPDSNFNVNYKYYGFLQSYGQLNLNVSVYNNSKISQVVLLDIKHTVYHDYMSENSQFAYAIGSQGNAAATFNRNNIFYLDGNNYVLNSSSGPIYNRTTYTFRVFGYNANLTNVVDFVPSVTFTVNTQGRGNVYRYNSDAYFLYNSLEVEKQILQGISTSGGNTVDAINAAAAQAHSDSTAINNQLQGDDAILDVINDAATTSENRINTVDSVIASAAPDADQAIQSVGSVITNNGTFWSNQRNASLFWKEIISDMYDSTITGYLGVGLSIVLIIILFVFILRL